MIACEIVIPLVSGRNKVPWPVGKIQSWTNAVCYLFGGISPIAVGVTGKWKDPQGNLIPDPQDRYEIAVDDELVDELREFMRFTCCHFEQQLLYFKVGVRPEFLLNPLGWP